MSVANGTGDGHYVAGEVVAITADPAPDGMRFWQWTGGTNGVADVFAPATTLVVGTNDVAVSAAYIPVVLRILDVVDGSGGGEHWECAEVAVVANPDPPYQVFDRWTGDAAQGVSAGPGVAAVAFLSGAVSISLSHSAFHYAQVRLGAAFCTTLHLLNPLATYAVALALWPDEAMNAVQWAGAALLIGGSALVVRARRSGDEGDPGPT